MQKDDNKKKSDLESILKRLERLEQMVLINNVTKRIQPIKGDKGFSGITGGLRLLISQDFFKKGRGLSETKDELRKREYHSSLQAVQTALNRLSNSSGPLIAFKENGKKNYAKRK